MAIQKNLARLIISVAVTFLSACKEEAVTTDIFELEEANPENLTSVTIKGMGDLYVNSDRINVDDGLAQIKGTLFSKVEDQYVAVTSGDFTLSNLNDGSYQELLGYGSAVVPEIGVFTEIITDAATGADFFMQNGAFIREQDPLAPLQSDLNYFAITLNEDIGERLAFTVKNMSFQPKVFYMDPNDPMIYFRGDVGTPNFMVTDAAIGLSARSQLEFTPYSYSEDLESIMKVPLPSLNGNIFIGGLVPIPAYSIEVYGEALVGFTANENGFTDFFENGFEGAAFRMGINGSVFLTDGFISYMPPMEVGRATVVVELEEAGDKYIQVAGESQISSNFLVDLLGKLDGGVLSSQFSMPTQVVEAYFYVGNNKDYSQFFIRTTLTMTIPGIGPQELVEAMFGVDAEHIFIGGEMGIPGLAEVYISGDVYYDGNFMLNGGASIVVDVEVASVMVGFDVLVTQDGFEITAYATGEIAETEFTVGVDVMMDWETGVMELCMNLPDPVGETCLELSNGSQRTLNGRAYTPRFEQKVISRR